MRLNPSMKNRKINREEEATYTARDRHFKAIGIVKSKIIAALKADILYTDQYKVVLTSEPESIEAVVEKTKYNKSKTEWHSFRIRMYQSTAPIEFFLGLVINGGVELCTYKKNGDFLHRIQGGMDCPIDALEGMHMLLGVMKPTKKFLDLLAKWEAR